MMAEFLNNPWLVGIVTSVGGTAIIGLIGKWRGWWWSKNKPESVDLASRVYQLLEGDVSNRTQQLISLTNQLGNSLVASYKTKVAHDSNLESDSLSLLQELLDIVNPLASELSAADRELDDLKRVIIVFQKGLERRKQIVQHLCHPPNPPAMDSGHIRDQLLIENTLPNDLLVSAKGEAIIFLRGHGIGWLERIQYFRRIRTKQGKLCSEAIHKEYRKVLQQMAIYKSKS